MHVASSVLKYKSAVVGGDPAYAICTFILVYREFLYYIKKGYYIWIWKANKSISYTYNSQIKIILFFNIILMPLFSNSINYNFHFAIK